MKPSPPSPVQEKARALRARFLSGEKIPLDDLREFILAAHSSLSEQRSEENKKAPAGDSEIDFF